MPLPLVRRFSFVLILCFAFCCSTSGAEQSNEASILVLRNARIHTMSDAGIFTGSIVIKDGKIVAVGPDIDIPEKGQVMDMTGHTIVPGLIDSRSVLWLTDAAIREGNSKGALNSEDGIDAWQENWREVSRQGVTSVYVQPANSGTLGGYGAVLRVASGAGQESLLIKSQAGLQAAFGITGSTSRDRMAQYQALKKALQAVIDGKEKEEKKETEAKETTRPSTSQPVRRPQRGRRGGQQRQSQAVALPDRTRDVLKKVVEREVPLRLEAHHSDAIRLAQQLATDFEIEVVIDGASRGARSSASPVPLIVGPLLKAGAVPAYRKNADWSWLPGFTQDGRLWALATFSTQKRGSRTLRFQAAAAIAVGVDYNEALKAVTINPARLLGVGDKVGSLEVGKQADIAVFAGDPLDPSVPSTLVISNGEITWQAEHKVRETKSAVAVELPETMPSAFVIQAGRLWLEGSFQSGVVTIQDGKVTAVGSNLPQGNSLPVFDLGEAVVTPGLVATHSHLGHINALGDSTESDQSHILAVDAFDPLNAGSRKMLEGGFIHIGFAPASASTSSGTIGQLRLGGDIEIIANSIASQFNLVDSARSNARFPASLNGQLQMVEAMFGGQNPNTGIYVSAAVERALLAEKKANIQAVLKRQRKAVFDVSTELEIEMALRITEAHNLDATLITSNRTHDFGQAIKDAPANLIVRSFNGDEFDSMIDEIAQASTSGISVAFAGESAEMIRLTAALTVAAGMPENLAMQALTRTGANVVGMQDETAVIQKGGNADLVIWSGSPLNLASKPLGVIVGGKLAPTSQGK